jgi:hypothetical protein
MCAFDYNCHSKSSNIFLYYKLAQWEQQWGCSLFIWGFLLKNPNNFCAFDVMLFMCAFQVMLDEMVIPRYSAVSTGSVKFRKSAKCIRFIASPNDGGKNEKSKGLS